MVDLKSLNKTQKEAVVSTEGANDDSRWCRLRQDQNVSFKNILYP